MSATIERLCGPDCCFPELPHLEPALAWIGNDPVMHGESDRLVPGSESTYDYGDGRGWVPVPGTGVAYCLCGHPNYLSCPAYYTEGIGGWTAERADGGGV